MTNQPYNSREIAGKDGMSRAATLDPVSPKAENAVRRLRKMYAAYLDDSKSKHRTFQVLSTVIMTDDAVMNTELIMAASVNAIIPEEKRAKFREFKAFELFGGYGVFDGIDQSVRLDVIHRLLWHARELGIAISYGAVNLEKLRQELFASADPQDICFRICVTGIHEWIRKNDPDSQVVLIADECDGKIKKSMRESFRSLRKPLYFVPDITKSFWNLHDGLYFGDSTESVGLQIADLCSYFIAKHHEKNEPAAEGFYKMIEDCITYSEVKPG